MEELGGYDDGLEIWGGEQYDLSFKVCPYHETGLENFPPFWRIPLSNAVKSKDHNRDWFGAIIVPDGFSHDFFF